jgi:hypothetical protein
VSIKTEELEKTLPELDLHSPASHGIVGYQATYSSFILWFPWKIEVSFGLWLRIDKKAPDSL